MTTDRELLEDAAKAAGIEVLSPSRWPIGQQQCGHGTAGAERHGAGRRSN